MDKQKGFVLTRGIIIVIGLLLVGLLILLLTLNPNRTPPQQDSVDQQQAEGEQEQPLTPEQQTEKNDAQTKEDTVRVASAITEYVANNSGSYPANDAQLDEVMSKYVRSKPFLSPLTQNSYILTLSATSGQGVMNLQRGTCNFEKNGLVPTENVRTYALITLLANKSAYCIDI